MESNQYGENSRRAILYKGTVTNALLETDSQTPFFNYGQGFFETILYENGILQYYKEHILRMKQTCSDFEISLDFSEIDEQTIYRFLDQSALSNHCCRLKILYAPIRKSNRWDTLVSAAPYTRPVQDFSLSVHDEVFDSRLNRYKSLNYNYNLYWKNHYKKLNNTDEVLLRNRMDNILEGSYTNILFVKNSTLYYVDKSCNYLRGIMQDRILIEAENIDGLKVQALNKGIQLDQLKTADEVMLCNSLMTVQNVKKIIFDDQQIKWPSSPSSDYLAPGFRDRLIK